MLEQRGIGFLERGAIEDSAQNMHGAKVRTVRRDANVDSYPFWADWDEQGFVGKVRGLCQIQSKAPLK